MLGMVGDLIGCLMRRKSNASGSLSGVPLHSSAVLGQWGIQKRIYLENPVKLGRGHWEERLSPDRPWSLENQMPTGLDLPLLALTGRRGYRHLE